MSSPVHLYFALHRDERGFPPFDEEELDATHISGNRYRIESIPVFACGLARGDVVEVVATISDGRLWVTRTVKESGHWTARVLARKKENAEQILSQFRALGCEGYVSTYGLIPLDIAPSVPASRIMDALQMGREDGTLDFDVGIAPLNR